MVVIWRMICFSPYTLLCLTLLPSYIFLFYDSLLHTLLLASCTLPAHRAIYSAYHSLYLHVLMLKATLRLRISQLTLPSIIFSQSKEWHPIGLINTLYLVKLINYFFFSILFLFAAISFLYDFKQIYIPDLEEQYFSFDGFSLLDASLLHAEGEVSVIIWISYLWYLIWWIWCYYIVLLHDNEMATLIFI